MLGGSAQENISYVQGLANRYGWRSMLDVGAGAGYYGAILASFVPVKGAIDIWPAAVDHLRKSDLYDYAEHAEAMDYLGTLANFPVSQDVIIFGDVLEHMEVMDAVICMRLAKCSARWVLVSMPCVPFPQDALYGNEHERHVIEDPKADLLPLLGSYVECREFHYTGTWLFQGYVD